MIQRITTVVSAVLLSLSLNAEAGLVTYQGYTLDEETNIVTGGGLEWLQWDLTANQSIDTAYATYAAEGWRLAEAGEMAGLLNAFDFGLTFDSDLSDRQAILRPWAAGDTLTNNPHLQLAAIFGDTFTELRANNGGHYVPEDDLHGAMALFGDTDSATYSVGGALDDYGYGLDWGLDAQAFMNQAGALSSDAFVPVGVALVRAPASSQGATPVPEPSSVAILVAGLLGLRWVKRERA